MKILIIALALVSSSLTFADEPAAAQQPTALEGVIPLDFDLANVGQFDDDPLKVRKAVEKYLEEHPDCVSEFSSACDVKILKEPADKCGKSMRKVTEVGGVHLGPASWKARQYDRSPSQGGSRPPGQSGHRVYGIGFCYKY